MIIDDSERRSVIREKMRGPESISGNRRIWHALTLLYHIDLVSSITKEIKTVGAEERNLDS